MSYMVINKMTAKPGKRDELIRTLLELSEVYEAVDECELMGVFVQNALPLLDGMHQQIKIEAAGGKHPFDIVS